MNSYAYAGNDPVAAVDPLGLYQSDVHYYMTYFLAITAGLSQQEAFTVALATQYIDNNPFTEPLNLHQAGHIQRLRTYHFTQDGFDPPQMPGESNADYARRRILHPANPQLTNLLAAANRNLRTANNPQGVSACTRAQLFGEYLHALEDTFGHRSQQNNTIGVNNGLGHVFYASDPDYTFNAGNWQLREYRTLEMEREVFNQIQANFGTVAIDRNGFPISFANIQNTLTLFNAIHEHEVNGQNPNDFPQKLATLNARLFTFGLGPIPVYDVQEARTRREQNLQGLRQQDYPGTILRTP